MWPAHSFEVRPWVSANRAGNREDRLFTQVTTAIPPLIAAETFAQTPPYCWPAKTRPSRLRGSMSAEERRSLRSVTSSCEAKRIRGLIQDRARQRRLATARARHRRRQSR